MAAVIYLDADDEITSAASRMRLADEKRVALVVPYGSRLATSRINFRLLAREAQLRGHRLSVVAGDAATRALAASAGLPVFGSVGEYEEAETSRPPAPEAGTAEAGTATAVATGPAARRRRAASGANGSRLAAPSDEEAHEDAGNGAAGALATGAGAAGATAARAGMPTRDLDATEPLAVAPETTTAERAGGPSGARSRGGSGGAVAGGAAGTAAAATTGGAGTTGATSVRAGVTAQPWSIPWRGRRVAWPYGQTGVIVAAGLIGLAVLALAVGAYVLLPSARATVAVRLERIGPVPMDVQADPGATAASGETAVIPAQRLTFDVAASGTFPASGVRVQTSRARGEVRFLSKNPVNENTINVGSIVSTPNGVQFRTTTRLRLPKATIVGLTVVPGEGTVAVEAVEPGEQGNVPSNAITVVPSNEDPMFLEVRNPEATRGGSRREFPVVEQGDVDAARAQLQEQLDAEFASILADPGRVPPGLTVFPESRALQDVLPTTDPATLVGQEVDEFELGLAATGTVLAVDPTPVEAVSAQRIADSVADGYRLVDGSVVVTPGEPIVTAESVTFPVSATASQVRVVDAAALREQIKGKPLDEARSILGRYGDVELTVWPDWVSTIPTIDSRVDVRVELPPGVGPPSSASPPPTASGAPSPGSPAPPSDFAPSGGPSAPASPVPTGSASDPGAPGPAGSADPSANLDAGPGGESPPP